MKDFIIAMIGFSIGVWAGQRRWKRMWHIWAFIAVYVLTLMAFLIFFYDKIP